MTSVDHAGNERDAAATEAPSVTASTSPARARHPGRIAVTAVALAVALAAWVVLVVLAVRLIGDARDGFEQAWWIVAIAAVGAAAALFLALLLGARLRVLWRGTPTPPRPVRVKGGKRAAR